MSTTLSFILAVVLAIFLFVLGAWLVYEGITGGLLVGIVSLWEIMTVIVGAALIVVALYVAAKAS